MPFSAAAAAAANFQFFLSLSGGCQKALRQSAAAAENFINSLRQRRRLENLKMFSVISGSGGSAARLTPLDREHQYRKYILIFDL
jgi:hypothetical protein